MISFQQCPSSHDIVFALFFRKQKHVGPQIRSFSPLSHPSPETPGPHCRNQCVDTGSQPIFLLCLGFHELWKNSDTLGLYLSTLITSTVISFFTALWVCVVVSCNYVRHRRNLESNTVHNQIALSRNNDLTHYYTTTTVATTCELTCASFSTRKLFSLSFSRVFSLLCLATYSSM